ncbi:MAG: adenylate/guanylate cyclase domain-containing protein [Micromonosporaceae bacterium]
MSTGTRLPGGLVTFLFTDIEGSTRLAQTLGPGYQALLTQHRRLLKDAFVAHGGVELFIEGDSLFFAFGDAAAALTACQQAQRALARHPWPTAEATPRVRMGLHSGWVQPRAGEYASPEVHRAARITEAAHGGQVLCSAATARHAGDLGDGMYLRDLGLYRLRGFEGRERLYQLVAPGLEHRFPRPRSSAAAPPTLPAPTTSFVGRARERRRLADLLSEYRLVTVAGPGGAGKTRLAVCVAADCADRYPDGVWFVDLAGVADGELVPVTVAEALGVRPEPGRTVLDTVTDHVTGRSLLLLLDTCDAHLAAAAQLVERVLAASGGTTVLATSREPLGLPGEVVWRIPPLSLVPPDDGGLSDAVALLADRTAAARGGHPVDPADLPHLERIAAILDGLPLALELAAARLGVLSAGQLAQRLAEELAGHVADVLVTLDAGRPAGTGRHATLEAAVGWSYRTLEDDAARLLRALSVFAGPVDLDTARWVRGGDPLPALSVLVDKSLLQVEAEAGTGADRPYRYRMLDPIRAFAARALSAAGEEKAARDRHVSWVREALDRAWRGPDGQPTVLSLDRFDPLAAEVRVALSWCATGGSGRAGLHLVCALDQWWRERGLAREARLWLTRLYRRVAQTGATVPHAEYATAYHVHSLQAHADAELAEHLQYSQRAEAAARASGDPALLTRVLAGRGTSLWELGRPEDAERVCREVIEYAERHATPADALFAVYCLARLLWHRGALDEAAELLSRARPAEAARPDVRGHRTVDMLLGVVALSRGDLVAAHDHLVVALRSRMEHGFRSRACDALGAMAVRCALGGDARTAARLFGAVHAARARLHGHQGMFGDYRAAHERALRARVGDEAFDRWYAEGAVMDLDTAAALALAVDQEPREDLLPAGSAGPGDDALGPGAVEPGATVGTEPVESRAGGPAAPPE